MRRRLGFVLLVAAAVLAPLPARAQKPAGPSPESNQPFVFSRGGAHLPVVEAARKKARAGDCKGALDLFDQALKMTVDPEVHRDRGLCHEQLGNAYPAMDDYRVYLRDRPNAPDADAVRDRLGRLEEAAGLGARETNKPASGGGDGASASASLSFNGEGAAANARGKSAGQAEFERDEKLAAAATGSPLRESTGWILGPYLGVRQSADVTSSTTVLGQPAKLKLGTNEAFGAAIRYSFSKSSTIATEVGWVGFNDIHVSGLGLFAGYEARFAITRYTSDAILLGAGVGYERYRFGETGDVLNNLLPRARLGYRHVFAEAIGLEVHGDGGLGYYWANGSDLNWKMSPVFGGYLALVVGF